MRRRFRELTDPLERDGAAMEAESWGYPRRIDEEETERGTWIAWGEAALFWYVVDGECGPGETTFHACAAPRHGAIAREAVAAVPIVADLLGYERLRCAMPEAHDFPARAGILRWFARSGWRRVGEVWYLDLGGME